jgi:lipoprotein-releasing system ATP-binding protein
LLPEFSAIENVMLPQMLNGLLRSEARVRRGTWPWSSSRTRRPSPSRLSGGEQQRGDRAGRGKCAAVLLADEPTGNLMQRRRMSFRQLMALVRETGMAALVATHNPDLAARMDRTVTLKDGVLSA